MDHGHLVNGWPGDPIKLRPFDFNFTVEKIIKSWLAVGFLPMTEAATFHPKVRHELGEGGAPEEAAKRLQLLPANYQQQAGILTMLGYNGAMLDLEIPMVADNLITGDDEAKINPLLANNSVNRAGGLFKAGQIRANGCVVNEVIKQRAAIIEEGKAKTTKKKEDERGWIKNEARKYYMT